MLADDLNPYQSPAPDINQSEGPLVRQFATPDDAAWVVVRWPWIVVLTSREMRCAKFFLRKSFDAAQRKLTAGHDPKAALGAARCWVAWSEAQTIRWVEGSQTLKILGRHWWSPGYIWNIPPALSHDLIQAVAQRLPGEYAVTSRPYHLVEMVIKTPLVPCLVGGLAFVVLGVTLVFDESVLSDWKPFGWPTTALGVVVVLAAFYLATRRPRHHIATRRS